MDFYWFEPLWSQGGGGIILLLLLVVAQALKAYFDARSARAEEGKISKKSTQQDSDAESDDYLSLQPKPRKERKRSSKKQSVLKETVISADNNRKIRGTLSRELAPQGEGTRFEAAPGTLDESQIVAPSVEPTVKSMLESMTGIYEASPTSSEPQSQPLTLDIQKLIAKPEGVRQAIILAEILKRPNY
jgi:hypothetical protein